ncbi:MAG TPA: hypothetical protein VIY86_13385, partial [Pirellulaceae bacterium]
GLHLDPSQAPQAGQARDVADCETDGLGRKAADGVAYWIAQMSREESGCPNTEFASLPVIETATRQWPLACLELEQKALSLRVRLARLEDQLQDAGDNPLRNFSSYQVAVSDLELLSQEIFEVRSEGERLRQQMKMDQSTFLETGGQELEAQAITPSLGIDPQLLSTYLLQDSVGQRVGIILDWLRWSRRFVPDLSQAYHRERGVTKAFRNQPRLPAVEIQTLVFRGDHSPEHYPFRLEGTLKHLTSHPELQAQPTEIVMQTTGEVQMAVRAVLDRRATKSRLQVQANCPHWQAPERQLGDPRQLALIASPGDCQMELHLDLCGETLQGNLTLNQATVMFTPRLPTDAPRELNSVFTEALRTTTQLKVQVSLAGSVEHPKWRIDSSLGAEVSEGVAHAIAREHLAARRSQHDATLVRLKALVEETQERVIQRQAAVDQALAIDDAKIVRLRSYVAARVDHNDGIIDPSSPLRETFRR